MVFLQAAVSDARLEQCKQDDHPVHHEEFVSSSVYGSRWAGQDIPRFDLPEDEMPPQVAYKLIKDELALDGNPVLNLASFVTTYMEEEAEKLMLENISKNFIDYEEYPMTVELHNRCVNIIARLFNAPQDDMNAEALGCSTIGSSEAIILSTLAMKRRWQVRRQAEGKDISRPNLIMGANVQVCWEKAIKYLEIEGRYVMCTEDSLILTPEKAIELVDENTIGIAPILGSTYTGHYEDVKKLNTLLNEVNRKTGWQIPIHVDAASGGFVAPFLNPDLEWDFRLNNVCSINVSGHKYGGTYAGVGWAIWRSKEYLPQDLIFNINYLGSDQASFTLNFSKGAANVIGQYYVLIRLGRKGFTAIMKNLMMHANHLADVLERTGKFKILSDRTGNGLPLVAFKLVSKDLLYDEFDVAARLRERGWIVPAYTAPPAVGHMKLMRVVIRDDFSRSRCEVLIKDIMSVITLLDKLDKKAVEASRPARARKHWQFAFRAVTLPGSKADKPESHVQVPKTNGVC